MGQTTLTMGATLQVGLAVTAHNNAVLNTSTVSNVTVSAAKVFSEADVGSVGFAGSHSISNGIHTVRGSGADIVGTVDAFHFSYVTLNGDGQIQVRVTAIQNTNAWAKAGIMFRNGLAANAQHASLLLSYANGVLFERRLTTAGATAETITGGVPVPYWLRMVRAGNLFTAYRSADGITWTLVGSATVAMPSSILVGMAVTSVNNAQLATDTFNYVSVP
jgi:regulation of enolase protein 1 (concanavalin A-like superfamily)